MNPYFNIFQSCTSLDERPPVSYKVREYLESFIIKNVLEKKKIIIGSKWRVDLTLAFCIETSRYKSDYIYMPKTPQTVTKEGVKIYEALIPLKLIKEAENQYLKTIELMYEAITIFFKTAYKKITQDLMSELWKNIDLDYLLSLPYPAPLVEQKYITDLVTPEGDVKNILELGWSEIQKR